MSLTLAKYMLASQIVADMQAPSKLEALKGLLAALPAGTVDETEALRALLEREALGSTGIGEGVAIPHGRASSLKGDAAVAFARCSSGIDYQSIDGKPVDLLFLILVSPQSTTHMKLLGSVSRTVQRPEVRDALRRAVDADELYRILTADELPA